MTREGFINWLEERFALTKNDIYEFGQLYDEVTKPQWISVEDELPPLTHKEEEFGFDYSDKVLVLFKETDADGMTITFAEYNQDHPRIIDGDIPKEECYWSAVKSCDMYEGFGDNITHWMPLPKMPVLSKSSSAGKDLKGGDQ